MTATLPAFGVATPMSGTPSNDEYTSLPLASWYQLTPALRHDGRTSGYAIVTLGGIWECDGVGHLTGYGHLLAKRHGTPAEDLALLGYGVQA